MTALRASALCLLFSAAIPALHAQSPVAALSSALSGEWTGVLEYRDYSEPETSTKRVQLPTWLAVSTGADGLSFHYIYDDGPNKIVEETDLVNLTPATWTEKDNAHSPMTYAMAGADRLKDGRGDLVLTGAGKDNDKPSEQRVTLTLRRNLLVMLEEVRPQGSSAAFVFRHRYVFTRSKPPGGSSTR